MSISWENLIFLSVFLITQNLKFNYLIFCIDAGRIIAVGKFEKDIAYLVNKLCKGEDDRVFKELKRLEESLITLHKENRIKISHSVMELVCAKYLISAGYHVELEKVLNSLYCDIYAQKGLGALIVEVETGFIPPEHALDPLTYLKARIASKITRYSGYAEKFGLAVPPHYAMYIPPALVEPPRARKKKDIESIKALCDLYYSNPPVSVEEIKNARIHAVYILDVENGTVEETDPFTYISMVKPMLVGLKGKYLFFQNR